ncbi:U-actitoxin-Avd3r-like isoform X2 [Sander lucioperca]|uniref:U-actitoxin-Avd3r-like isoform X2 n=1 Tax=Sander lucioperca TaxID=283035 RepID=UPI00125D66F1|nr:U-actitoxin-Avd3r-like isoform X2 [Sander lucioperca]
MFFLLAVAVALGFPRTGLAHDERCLDFLKDSSCQSDGPRFFYNSTSSSCERLFGGCWSNRTTFSTLEGCEALCYGNATTSSPLTEDPDTSRWVLICERSESASVEGDAIRCVCF